jgi:predicted exporter
MATHVFGKSGAMQSLLQQLGFSSAAATERVQNFAANTTPLDLPEWLASSASEPWRDLWLGRLGDASDAPYASIVSLAGVEDVTALQAIAQSASGGAGSISFVDRVQSISEVLGHYRRAVSWLLCGVYVAAALLLSYRYGWRDTPLLLLPSALASVVTLGLFGWTGVPVNLFTLLALWLVLGLGIDYGIFLRHGRHALSTAVLSVTLSATTTLIAFGMLAFSATPFIRSIGLTLLCAISLSWLFALLSCLSIDTNPAETAA